MKYLLTLCAICSFGATNTVTSSVSLRMALTNNTIIAGDYVELVEGTYQGNFVCTLGNSTNGWIFVKPKIGATNVLVTDGIFGQLLTTMNNAGTQSVQVVIANSEGWNSSQVIIIENETLQLNGRGSSPTNWTVIRGWNGTATNNHSIGAQVIILAPLFDVRGTNVIFYGLQLTSLQATQRVIAPGGTNNWYVSPAFNLYGSGNSVVNCVLFNCGHPCIARFTTPHYNSEIYGNIIWGTGFYDWNGATWIRGNGAYTQNEQNTLLLQDNISFANFTEGMEGYGETGPVSGFVFDHNIAFRSPNNVPLSCSSGSRPMTNNIFGSNVVMGPIRVGYQGRTNRLQNMIGNFLVNSALPYRYTVSGTVTNNTFLIGSNTTATDNSTIFFESDSATTAESTNGVNINRNFYYLLPPGGAFHPQQFAFESSETNANAGNLTFSQWQTYFDANSTYLTNWPSIKRVEARNNRYNSNTVIISIVCTTGETNAEYNPHTNGFVSGDILQLRDAQNYFTPVLTLVYDGFSNMNIPLNLTGVAEITGTITHYTNEHTSSLFNAFIVTKIGTSGINKSSYSGKLDLSGTSTIQ